MLDNFKKRQFHMWRRVCDLIKINSGLTDEQIAVIKANGDSVIEDLISEVEVANGKAREIMRTDDKNVVNWKLGYIAHLTQLEDNLNNPKL